MCSCARSATTTAVVRVQNVIVIAWHAITQLWAVCSVGLPCTCIAIIPLAYCHVHLSTTAPINSKSANNASLPASSVTTCTSANHVQLAYSTTRHVCQCVRAAQSITHQPMCVISAPTTAYLVLYSLTIVHNAPQMDSTTINISA